MHTFELATEPKTIVVVDPTAPDGESALNQIDDTDNHVAIVVGLAGPSAQALRQYAAAEEIDISTAAAIYLDQVADRIQPRNRLIERVAVAGSNMQAEVAHLVSLSPTRRILFPDRATSTASEGSHLTALGRTSPSELVPHQSGGSAEHR